uniref:Uncharacterized protein n=1 Tax=Rhizophora mucronata TaxID=61149 RepID=A0A2P2N6I7_RHIMU
MQWYNKSDLSYLMNESKSVWIKACVRACFFISLV